jgi:YidC/Oxa1 family membrane protein insertase
MFDWIASIFKYPMQWFYSFTGSYVISLILFALLVRILFLPMSIHQQKLQIKGAKLRPRIAIIEKKYEGLKDPESRQKMQQEIMELQQKEGYSPFSGCLPLLLQLPVIMGLYQIIRKPLTFLMDVSLCSYQRISDIRLRTMSLHHYKS